MHSCGHSGGGPMQEIGVRMQMEQERLDGLANWQVDEGASRRMKAWCHTMDDYRNRGR